MIFVSAEKRNPTLPYIAFSPTHVIFDLSSPTASTSTGSSPPRGSFTDARLEISSSPTLRSPDIPSIRLPTPESSLRPLSPGVLTDASIIASYEVAHAFDSPRSNLDIQSISNTPFSSRPQSPFSNFSGLGARQGAALFEAPVSEMDFFSDNGSFVPSVGGSVVGDDFDVQSNHWDASSTSSWVSAGTSSG
jgi:hypothetical protein